MINVTFSYLHAWTKFEPGNFTSPSQYKPLSFHALICSYEKQNAVQKSLFYLSQ